MIIFATGGVRDLGALWRSSQHAEASSGARDTHASLAGTAPARRPGHRQKCPALAIVPKTFGNASGRKLKSSRGGC